MNSYRNSEPRPPIMQGSPPALVPPKLDWNYAPWNRWSFQHVRELLPTAEVWRGAGPVRQLPRDERGLDELPVVGVDGEAASLATLLDQTYTDGFLVLKRGAVVFERYFNGMETRTLHLSQSLSKSFVGMLTGILAARGVIDVTAPLTAYVPELDATAYRGGTAQHVLNMTSGVRFGEDYTDPLSEVSKVDFAAGWKPAPPGIDPSTLPQSMYELIMSLKTLEVPHGQRFSYRSIETDVLALVLERATGKRLPQLLSEEIWQPAGMEDSGCMPVDSTGFVLADGGLNASLRDYARFGQMILDGGAGIVPAGWIEATRAGDHAMFGGGYHAVLPQGAYCNQFWIEDPHHKTLMARGVFGQLIYVSWEFDMVAVKLSSWPVFVNPGWTRATLAAVRRIGEALS
jgi:CubicO group peptidase (beta-lactamase class C family)